MDLHGRIMNIADNVTTNTNAMAGNDAFLAYKEGHRDARHAAAELALKASGCIDCLQAIVNSVELNHAPISAFLISDARDAMRMLGEV